VGDEGGGDEGGSDDDIDVDACLRDTAGSDGEGTLSGASGGANDYPSIVFNDRQVIQKVAAAQKGQRTLEQVDMQARFSQAAACATTSRSRTVELRVPAHAPWLARRSLVRRATRMTCHAPVRTGGAGGAGWDLD